MGRARATSKVASLPILYHESNDATATRYFEQRVIFFAVIYE